MSSSEDAGCDLRDYFSYTTQNYGQDERPPLISKKSRIIFAVVGGDVEALESLLDSPRWYNVRDQSGHDLLQIAILLYKRQVFNFLLSLEGYPFDAVDKRGLTPLHVAVTVGHRKEYFAMKLIRKGADVHATSKSGDTPLHYAIYRDCNLKIVEFLIINGADINAQNCDGETPLHKMFTQLSMNSAVLIEAVSMILYYGSDVSIPNKLGQNAL
ncbi:Ankyrin repeat domain containing protein, partial [Asbolus verrucosus]